jgi:hypothetical protein
MDCILPAFDDRRYARIQAYLHAWSEADRRKEYAEALAAYQRDEARSCDWRGR